jgi:cytoskeletal protein CcmA (bactofilin family)
MLQSSDNVQRFSPNTYVPPKTVTTTAEQATIGRSLVIKGEVRGEESIYIDGQIEGTIHFAEHRVTIGRNGKVTANISAREVVIMGSVKGNIQCTDRVDIRAEGCLTGDVVTQRISVEDGAILKGSVQIRTTEAKPENKKDKSQNQSASTPAASQPAQTSTTEPLAAAAGK